MPLCYFTFPCEQFKFPSALALLVYNALHCYDYGFLKINYINWNGVDLIHEKQTITTFQS